MNKGREGKLPGGLRLSGGKSEAYRKKVRKSLGLEINLTVKKKNKTAPHRCAPGSAKSLTRLCVVYKKQSQNESNSFFFFQFSNFLFFIRKNISIVHGCSQMVSKPRKPKALHIPAPRKFRRAVNPGVWLLPHFTDCTLYFREAESQQVNLVGGDFHRGLIQLQKQVKGTMKKVSMPG